MVWVNLIVDGDPSIKILYASILRMNLPESTPANLFAKVVRVQVATQALALLNPSCLKDRQDRWVSHRAGVNRDLRDLAVLPNAFISWKRIAVVSSVKNLVHVS